MSYLKAKLPLFGHLMATFALFLILFSGLWLYFFCGYYNLELEYENNNRTTLVLREGKFSVQNIFYENKTIHVIDSSLEKDDCNSLPLSSIYVGYFISYFPPRIFITAPSTSSYYYSGRELDSIMYVVNCWKPIKSSQYIDASRCTTKSNTSSPPTSFFYCLDENTVLNLNQTCTVKVGVPIMVKNISGMSTLAIYNKLSKGFYLSWYYSENYYELSLLQYLKRALHHFLYGIHGIGFVTIVGMQMASLLYLPNIKLRSVLNFFFIFHF
ncbi:hypothetical protein ERO13_D01G033066v2 [Gossypium hirsutum]|nr:hypothetical protein ERO13_D01G033066v2 [Gossypium hirsutum]